MPTIWNTGVDRKRAIACALAATTMGSAVAVALILWRRRRGKGFLEYTNLRRKVNAPLATAMPNKEEQETAIAKLFAEVKKRSGGVMYIVSNKNNSTFSASNLASYLRQKGLSPFNGTELEDILANAQILVELLERKGDTCRSLASTMRHVVVRQGFSHEKLQELFPFIKSAYMQQPLDYGRNSRYGDNWRISCYLVVMENWKPKIEPHQPMVACLEGVMHECVAAFERWFCEFKSLTSVKASVMNAFVTRYKPIQGEDELQKHIDGANVDGSVILALPTDDPYEGGGLHVWDGRPQQELIYSMAPGDLMFLDNAVWHQAKPISSGTRWSLVLFLRLNHERKGKTNGSI